jgi:hypothetical protein
MIDRIHSVSLLATRMRQSFGASPPQFTSGAARSHRGGLHGWDLPAPSGRRLCFSECSLGWIRFVDLLTTLLRVRSMVRASWLALAIGASSGAHAQVLSMPRAVSVDVSGGSQFVRLSDSPRDHVGPAARIHFSTDAG